MRKIKCAVIGVGYLGEFHSEKYAKMEEVDFVAVCDIDSKRCHQIAVKHQVQAFIDYRDLLGKVDAVSIVVPTHFHYSIAKFFLENHVHVLVEKPVTSTVEEADKLIALAKKNNCILQVGHLERFNPVLLAVDKIINKPRFIESHRLATFNPRGTEVNVMLDLMIHDIDIIQYLVKSPIKLILANGASVLTSTPDIANARIQFNNHCVANVTASRVSFRKERRMRIFQHDAYITFDLQNKHLSVHKKGNGEMFPGIPEIITEEQTFTKTDELRDEIAAFINSIYQNKPAIVSGEDGKKALATAIEITNLVNAQFKNIEETCETSTY